MKDIYYEKGSVVVRRSKSSDVNRLAPRLRKSDVEEIWASNHIKPYEALREGLDSSLFCLSVEDRGEVVCMFGINPLSVVGDKAVVWMLASDGLDKIKIKFLKHSKEFVNMMLSFYPYLFNYVDARNAKSIEWLKFCGAKIEEAKPFGVENSLFHYFSFERK